MTQQTAMPSSPEAEKGLLGLLLWQPQTFPVVAAISNYADFYRQDHQMIYKAIQNVVSHGDAIDPISVSTDLEKAGITEILETPAISYLYELQNRELELFDPSPPEHRATTYARIIADKAERRRLYVAISQMTTIASNGVKDPTKAAAAIIEELTKSNGNGQHTQPLKRKFLYASEVQPEPVDWHWKKRLARGMLTLLVGDPGLGKGLLCATIAAETTNGSKLPDGKAGEPGGVIIMSPEDSYQHTIVPRLIAAGADLQKIILLSEVPDFNTDGTQFNRPVSFPEDAAILEEAIIECRASLAIIDPVLAMVNGKYDTHKDQEARSALGRMLTVAERQQCAVLGIFHLNKSQSGNVLYRSAASIAFIAMARVGLFLVPDPDDTENGRVLVNHKNNLAAKAVSLRFTIEQTQDEIGYIRWNGESSYTEQELLNQSTPTDNPKSEQETGLIEVLKENGLAMTPAEIHEKLQSRQSLNALEQMLKRKLEQGILVRPSRGLYTYNGNPLYTAKTKSEETDVSNVSNVSLHRSDSNVTSSNIADSDMSVLGNGYKATPEAMLAKTDKTDMTFGNTAKQKRDDRGFFVLCQADNCTWPNETAHNGLCKRHWQEMREAAVQA